MIQHSYSGPSSHCCSAHAVGPFPLTSFSRPPRIHLMSLTWWMRPGLPHFLRCSASVYYTERKPKSTKGGRPGNEAKNVYQVSVLFYYTVYIIHHCGCCSLGKVTTELQTVEVKYNKLPCNHGNYHLVIMHIIMAILSCHVYEGHTNQNAAPSGKSKGWLVAHLS